MRQEEHYCLTGGDFKRRLVKYTRNFNVLLTIGVFLIISSAVFNHQDEYASYIKYNDLRTTILDYPERMPSWNELKASGGELKISKNDYWMFRKFNIADPEVFTIEVLEHIASYQKPVERSAHNIKQSIVKIMDNDNCKISYFVIFMLFVILLVCGNGVHKITVFLCGLGTLLLLIHFMLLGRCPLRVSLSVAIPALCTLIFILSKELSNGKKQKWIAIGIVLMVAFYTFMIFDKKDFSTISLVSIAKDDSNDEWKDTYTGTEFYLWNVYDYDAAIQSTYGKRRKINSQLFLEHNNPLGEWHEGSIYLKKYRERLNISNPLKSLLIRDDVYLVANKDSDHILKYIQEHYDKDAVISKVGEINGNSVLKIYKG